MELKAQHNMAAFQACHSGNEKPTKERKGQRIKNSSRRRFLNRHTRQNSAELGGSDALLESSRPVSQLFAMSVLWNVLRRKRSPGACTLIRGFGLRVICLQGSGLMYSGWRAHNAQDFGQSGCNMRCMLEGTSFRLAKYA